MPEQLYEWKRFWCSREGHIRLDGGFVADPNSWLGRAFNPHLLSFEEIASNTCLVLLGEPGIGKTTTMQREIETLTEALQGTTDRVLPLNLNLYSTDSALRQDLFENPVFTQWAGGDYVLHLFLDSLDECLLEIKIVAELLGRKLADYDLRRLRLRIACRTAVWPASLETALEGLWGKDGVGIYELTPLLRKDAAEAARVNGLDPAEFLKALAYRDVESLASKPVTLDLLLRKFQVSGALPENQAALYLEGCRLLCEEVNPARRAAGHTGTLDPDQRLAVSARIAAMMLLGKRSVVWMGTDVGRPSEECITLRELVCWEKPVQEAGVEVTEAVLREVLDTGLFTSRGPEQAGWAHQTYAEFLAARYLVQHGLTVNQMMSLVSHPRDPEGRLVPQLQGVAAWLAAMEPDVFAEIAQHEPEVLLQSNVTTDTEEQTAALVDAFLSLVQTHPELLHEVGGNYRNLRHARLSEQLQPWIADVGKGMAARYAAIDIAQACEVHELQSQIASVALSEDEDHHLRVNAAHAVSEIGDADTKASLKPLVLGQAGPDPDDGLKGCGLRALWPDHLTTDELFSLLTAPKADHGPYWAFLVLDLPNRLRAPDLSAALRWVGGQPARSSLPFSLSHLVDEIMWSAWQHLDTEGVAEAFAAAALSRVAQFDRVLCGDKADQFRADLAQDDVRRRRVLMAMVPLLVERNVSLLSLALQPTPFVCGRDVTWLLGQLDHIDGPDQQRVIAELVRWSFDIKDISQVEGIYTAYQSHTATREAFAPLIEAVLLDSAEAEQARKQLRLQREMSERGKDVAKKQTPDTQELIKGAIDATESGDPAGWWRLCLFLTLDESAKPECAESEPDLKETPGWRAADEVTKVRIVEAARRYVLTPAPEAEAWQIGQPWDRPSRAGYKALRLLMAEDPEWIRRLNPSVWQRWARIIVAYYRLTHADEDVDLACLAYRNARDEVLGALRNLIEDREGEHVAVNAISRLEPCWDDQVAACALEKARDPETDTKHFGLILSLLLKHRVTDAEDLARSLVSPPKPVAEEDRPKAVVAAYLLLRHAEDAGWDIVYPAIQQDAGLCDNLVSRLSDDLWLGANQDKPDTPLYRLTEQQLGDLFRLLVIRYPYATHRLTDGGSINRFAQCRDAVLGHLRERGTRDAVEQLQRFVAEMPDLPFLRQDLRKAQHLMRQTTWTGWQPVHILALAESQEKRLVEDGTQLLEVVVESLDRLQERLQGERAIVEALWNTPKKGPCGPKDESFLSDFVAEHLERDLRGRRVIVNREPEIRRGKQTDIRIDAAIGRDRGIVSNRITAIIEVKGCWHRDVESAMADQLVGRYMRPNGVEDGLYLVGWFNCDKWNDGREKQVPRMTLEDAREFFDQQARDLSQETFNIRAVVLDAALR